MALLPTPIKCDKCGHRGYLCADGSIPWWWTRISINVFRHTSNPIPIKDFVDICPECLSRMKCDEVELINIIRGQLQNVNRDNK
jgi:hypothetical protein